jgi:hypothetical protein
VGIGAAVLASLLNEDLVRADACGGKLQHRADLDRYTLLRMPNALFICSSRARLLRWSCSTCRACTVCAEASYRTPSAKVSV